MSTEAIAWCHDGCVVWHRKMTGAEKRQWGPHMDMTSIQHFKGKAEAEMVLIRQELVKRIFERQLKKA